MSRSDGRGTTPAPPYRPSATSPRGGMPLSAFGHFPQRGKQGRSARRTWPREGALCLYCYPIKTKAKKQLTGCIEFRKKSHRIDGIRHFRRPGGCRPLRRVAGLGDPAPMDAENRGGTFDPYRPGLWSGHFILSLAHTSAGRAPLRCSPPLSAFGHFPQRGKQGRFTLSPEH